MGGSTADSNRPVGATLELVDGEWKEVGSLTKPRTALACTEHLSKLWALGGEDNGDILRNLDPE